MVSEELPSSIINLSKDLTAIENRIFEFADDSLDDKLNIEIWHEIMHGYPIDWPRPLSRMVRHSINGTKNNINIIPGGYGMNGNCQDTLMIVIEPSRFIYQADEYNVEMRIIKRIGTAVNFVSTKCINVKYILFWAGIWDYYSWNTYKNKFTKQKIYLKPWGMNTIQVK